MDVALFSDTQCPNYLVRMRLYQMTRDDTLGGRKFSLNKKITQPSCPLVGTGMDNKGWLEIIVHVYMNRESTYCNDLTLDGMVIGETTKCVCMFVGSCLATEVL